MVDVKRVYQHTRQLHEERVERARNGSPYVEDEELDRQLHHYWLRHLPGYREEVRQRISEAQKQRRTKDVRLLGKTVGREAFGANNNYTTDVDNLGMEVEGCG